jgi:hypothetical protein
MKKTVSGVSLALGLASGCMGGGPGEPAPATPAATTTIITVAAQADLDKLRALDVFEVGRLLVALPAEATSCYNLPCRGWEDRAAAEVARQMPRLDRLTQIAVGTSDAIVAGSAAPDAAELAADLQKLRDLQIVQIGDLVVSQPQAEANCYNLPCPGEQEAADAANHRRAVLVKRLADAAGDLDR